MKKVVWEVRYLSPPPALKYCKRCGEKTEFLCSGQFRINAQRRYLDVWLIYKCSECDVTWNAAVISRVSPQAMEPALLDGFYKNDETLAKRYAMDVGFLHGNGAEAGSPSYAVTGESFSLTEDTELKIMSRYSFPIKVSAVVREKLHLSQQEFARLTADGKIKSIPETDLKKCKLKDGITLRFERV